MTLAWLAKSSEFMAKTSSLAKRTSSGSLEELASFEREAALAQTAPSLSPTPPNVLDNSRTSAELLHTVKFDQHGDTFRMEMRGEAERGAAATLTRSELQRIIQMLRETAAKARWIDEQSQTAAASSAAMVRH
jgi:hypothetical protein